jgi:hypothetical protein
MDDQTILAAVVALSDQTITRLEVIDEDGRSYVHDKRYPLNVEISMQDQDRTMKIFINRRHDHA